MKLVVLLLLRVMTLDFDHAAITQRMHDFENQERRRVGFREAAYDPQLSELAQRHAEKMARYHWYKHSGMSMEIIHRGPTTARRAVADWTYSPAHRGIMLSGSRLGHGHAVNGGVHYWVTLVR